MSEESRTSEENASEEEKEEKQPPKKRMKKIQNQKKKEDKPKEKESKEKKESVDANEIQEKPKRTRGKGNKKRSQLDHPRTIDMIIEAIESLEDSNGSSVQAIKSYILTNFKVRDDMIKSMIKRALTSALKDNLLVRPKNQSLNAQILSGRYLIRRKKPDEIEPPKPRPSQLRQLSVLKSQKNKMKTKTKKKKKKRKGFY